MDNDDTENKIEVNSATDGEKAADSGTKAEILAAKQRNLRETQKAKGKNFKFKKSHWAIKATVITFFLSAFFSFVANMTESAGNIIVTVLLLIFLILGSIIFDGIGVAVAACEIAPLTAMASRKVKGSKMAIKLVNNADIVSNICNDVIGDIFGILSGACTVIIATKITLNMETVQQKIISIVISAVVSALIVGGKAFLKNYAIYKSKELVMMTARILSVFTREDRKDKKRKYAKNGKKENTVLSEKKPDNDKNALR